MKATDHLGNKFSSINKMAVYWGIPQNTLLYRERSGMSIEEALTTPVAKLKVVGELKGIIFSCLEKKGDWMELNEMLEMEPRLHEWKRTSLLGCINRTGGIIAKGGSTNKKYKLGDTKEIDVAPVRNFSYSRDAKSPINNYLTGKYHEQTVTEICI